MSKLVILVLFATYSLASFGQSILPRAASDEVVVPRVAKYEELLEAAKVEGDRGSLLKAIDITFACQRSRNRLTALSNSQGLPAQDWKSSQGLTSRELAMAQDRNIVDACDRFGVGGVDEAFDWLEMLADEGFVPAQVYFVRTPPGSVDNSRIADTTEYVEKSSQYLDSAISHGSGEAMALKAYQLKKEAFGSENPRSSLEESFAFASAAVECGYSHPNLDGLMRSILVDLDYDVQSIKQQAHSIANTCVDKSTRGFQQ